VSAQPLSTRETFLFLLAVMLLVFFIALAVAGRRSESEAAIWRIQYEREAAENDSLTAQRDLAVEAMRALTGVACDEEVEP
jgi:hypothetical protein